MRDPIVDEVRKHRMEHARQFGGDLEAICEDLQAIERTSGHKVVRLPAVRLDPRTRTPAPTRPG